MAENTDSDLDEQLPLVHPVPPTGFPTIDEAAARLGELDNVALDEHPAIFSDIHDRLASVLTGAMEARAEQ